MGDHASYLRTLLEKESVRQNTTVTLIASENYASPAVRAAIGSIFTNKYSEGEPRRRYYQGNAVIDEVETYVDALIRQAFSLDGALWHVNPKAISASIANFCILNALLSPGERILSMHLYDGGHLSHGWDMDDRRGVTIAGRVFDVSRYHVNKSTHVIDYDELATSAYVLKPHIIITGGTAYPREIDHARVGRIAKDVGAYYMADVAHEAGLIAGGVNASPFPHADVVSMSTQKTLRGPRASIVVCRKELAELIDRSIFPGMQGGPFNHHIFAIGIAMAEALTESFRAYAKQVVANAKQFEQEFKREGLRLVANGTDKHLLVLDFSDDEYTGKDIAVALEEAGIVSNYNTIPFDQRKPFNPSGLRIGTPAVTTRGMGEKEISGIAHAIVKVIRSRSDAGVVADVRRHMSEMCEEFPVW